MTGRVDRSSPVRSRHVAGALLTLAAVRLGLRCLGYRRCMAIANRMLRGCVGRRRPDADEMSRVLGHIAVAAALFPGRTLCLEQSLALYVLLGRRGFPVQLRLGVQPFPFTAHAWVECEGKAVNETDEFVRHFAPLPAVSL